MSKTKLMITAAFCGMILPSFAALSVPVGGFQPRFKLDGAGGNGSSTFTMAQSAEGVFNITYTGTIADFGLTTNADEARPFIFFGQGATGTAANFVYIDNISLTVGGAAIWTEDFSGATLGATSGNNQNLTGTTIQTANALSSEVVAAPAAFTSGSGNVALLSLNAANEFAAIRSSDNPIDFSSVPNTTAYTMSFDLYIVPEPSTALLSCLGVLGLLRRRR
ncbi:PEP-CTERM sorting domain-containing protein [Luteolibacter algae]|uniref:PEP-CTERM sorting domain-containing protein n=1 Tax=Luteolibacter algae TaxID=454151 RepID=A0ABW5D602_9BACT